MRKITISFVRLILLTIAQVAVVDALELEEIVVTAEKREQNLFEVPVAVDAFTSDQLEQGGYDDIGELQTLVPSLVVGGYGHSRPFVYIRGVGTRKFDAGAEGSVGVFVDEVYNTRFSTALQGVVDLERVEVLKGPQGTLYGRNTIGGAISLFTKKPTNETEGRIKVGIGDEGYRKFSGFVSGAISDNWNARLSGSTKEDDGSLTEVLSGQDNGVDMTVVRLNAVGNPSDELEINFTVQATKLEQSGKLSRPVIECGRLIAPTVDGRETLGAVARHLTITEGGPPLGGIGAIPPLQGLAASVGLTSETCYYSLGPIMVPPFYADIASGRLVDEVRAGVPSAREVSHDVPGFTDSEATQTSLKIVKDFDALTLTTITSFTSEELQEELDFDGHSHRSVFTEVNQESDQIMQEIRLNGQSDRLAWVAGLFYMKDEADRSDNFKTGIAAPFPPHQYGVFPPPPAGPFVPVPGLTGFNMQTVAIDSTAMAAYGQLTYAITDTFNVTIGARFSDDEKEYDMDMDTNTLFPFVTLIDNWSETLNYESFDPRITFDYALGEAAMTYLTYSTGYKSGGVSFASWSRSDSLGGFDKEELTTLEVGYKGRLMDGRMQIEAAVYQYEYEDQQQQIIVPNFATGAMAGQTLNAAESDMTGYELSINYLLTPELLIDLSYAGQDAEFDSFVVPQFGLNFSGHKMNYAPENAYVIGVTYQSESITARVNYSWNDEMFFDPSNRFISLQDDYSLVNASLSFNVGEDVNIRLFCNNCSDEEYLTQVTTFPLPFGGGGREHLANARRLGAEISVNF